jgi:hypothetical protein
MVFSHADFGKKKSYITFCKHGSRLKLSRYKGQSSFYGTYIVGSCKYVTVLIEAISADNVFFYLTV